MDASSGESPLAPYLVAVDVSELSTEDEYLGFFRVSVDTLLSKLYPELCMGLTLRGCLFSIGIQDSVTFSLLVPASKARNSP